jgi:hypothetical protein
MKNKKGNRKEPFSFILCLSISVLFSSDAKLRGLERITKKITLAAKIAKTLIDCLL